MRILALDTALEACAACVFDTDEGEIATETLLMTRGHAEALVPLVERVVAKAGGFSPIDRIATTVGPGSFTGLRVAISAGRAFALALRIPCVGVSTLAAMAAPYIADTDGLAVGVAIDARHGQIYFQLFSARGRSLIEARCMPAKEAARALGNTAVKLVGPGAALLMEEARAVGAGASVAHVIPAPDIGWVARLGLVADPQGARPRPSYLKPADATPQQNGKVARQ